MTRLSQCVSLGLFAAALAWAAAPAHAQWSLVDDFGTYTLGSSIGGQGDWTSDGAGNIVTVDPANAANNVLFIPTENTSTFSSHPSINIPNGQTGTLFMRINMPAGAINTNFGLTNVDNPSAFDDFRVQNRVLNGVLDARDGGAFVSLTSGGNSVDTTNLWYNLWMVADNSANTVQTYVQSDDDLDFLTQTLLNVPDGTQNFRVGTTEALDRLFLRSGSDNGAGLFFDDFFMDGSGVNLSNPLAAAVVPEPASLALWSLLGLAGAALGWQRLRRRTA